MARKKRHGIGDPGNPLDIPSWLRRAASRQEEAGRRARAEDDVPEGTARGHGPGGAALPPLGGHSLEKFQRQLRDWSKSLVDIGRRNRLLYYRKTKSTLEFEAPGPDVMLRVLTNGRSRALRLWLPPLPRDEETAEGKDVPEAESTSDTESGENPTLPRDASPDRKHSVTEGPEQAFLGNETMTGGHQLEEGMPGEVDEDQPGPEDVVATTKDRRALERALKNLQRSSREVLVERGLWTLYLAIGMLIWEETPGEIVRSPLLLLPVRLDHDVRTGRWTIGPADEDPVVNPALSIRLEHDFELELPEWEELEELLSKDGSLDWSQVRSRILEVVGGRKGWSVEDVVILRPFTFHKEAIYRDLQDNEESIRDNALVRVLALGTEAGVDLSFDPIPEDDLDRLQPPEDVPLILDADSSQRRCIAAALEGRSFVMDGPPGTGKSQTIANIIAAAIAQGKSVLFVSEKMAALAAVKKRLDQRGLGHFLLELHSHKARRREVAAALGGALDETVKPGHPLSAREKEDLRRLRSDLDRWAEALNTVDPKLEMTLNEALGRELLLRGDRLPEVSVSLDVEELTAGQLSEIVELARRMSRAWAPVDQPDFPWVELDPAQREVTLMPERIVRRIGTAEDALQWFEEQTRRVAERVELELLAHDENDALRLANALAALNRGPKVQPRWLSVSDQAWEESQQKAAELVEVGRRRNRLEEEGSASRGPQWRVLERGRVLRGLESVEKVSAGKLPCGVRGSWAAMDLEREASDRRDVADRWEDLMARIRRLVGEVGLDVGTVMTRTSGLARALSALCERRPEAPDPALIREALAGNREKVRTAVEQLTSALEEERGKAKIAGDLFTPEILQADPASLEQRFREEYRGFTRVFRRSWWRDRRTLASCTVTGDSLSEAIDRLDDAIAWKEARTALERAIGRVREILGDRHLKGAETDLDELQRMIGVAGSIAEELAPLVADPARLATFLGAEPGDADAQRLRRRAEELHGELVELFGRLPELSDEAPAELDPREVATLLREVASRLEVAANALRHAAELAGRSITLDELRSWVADLEQIITIERRIEELAGQMGEFLTPLYEGFATDWNHLEESLQAAAEARRWLGEPVPEYTAELLVEEPPADELVQAHSKWARAREGILALFSGARREEVAKDLAGKFRDSQDLLEELRDKAAQAPTWWEWHDAKEGLEALGLGEVVEWCIEAEIEAERVGEVVEWSVLSAWIDRRLSRLASIVGSASGADRDELVRRFRDLDKRLISAARNEVARVLVSRLPHLVGGEVSIIHREARKKRRHMPVRELLRKARGVVRLLKPCFLMSPLSVSQYLPPDYRFDLVIFDEASQVLPGDAINCIYRGRQLIVAGDEKQLPPTTFFATGEDDDDMWEEDQVESFESLLDLCKGSGGFPGLPLRWHYRSRNEYLVAFSNHAFYDGSLVTFPTPGADSESGVFFHRADGWYDRGGSRRNQIEAREVARLVEERVTRRPEWNIGVVAFSRAQQDAILDAMEERARDSRVIRNLLSTQESRDGFFVKNLETVQGDERDVIVLSVGYGPDRAGKFTMNFGPLNRENGWRRLNVAVTRARQRVDVVCSFDPDAITPGSNRSLVALRDYLLYARDQEEGLRRLVAGPPTSEGEAESPFEEAVAKFLRRHGYDVVHQVGTAGYRIDLGVLDPAREGRFLLGIECDGAMYHSSRVARDRDRLRQEVLEGLGWRIHRVWGPAWYRNQEVEGGRLLEAIERARHGSDPPSRVDEDRRNEADEEDLPLVPNVLPTGERPKWARVYRPTTEGDLGFRITKAARQSDTKLRQAIEVIVRKEGPIAAVLLERRLREFFRPRGRQNFRSQVSHALDRLQRDSRLVREGDAWLLRGQVQEGVRIPDEGDPSTLRKAEEIPVSELASCLQQVIEDVRGINEEELFRIVRGLFGWGRTGERIRKRLERALEVVVAEVRARRVQDDEGNIRLIPVEDRG